MPQSIDVTRSKKAAYMRRFRRRPDQREKERIRSRKRRAKRTPAQKEAERIYQLRYYHEVKAATPERRAHLAAIKMKYKAKMQFDREYDGLPEDMACCNPHCDNPQVSDQYGPTGLCAEHLAATR